MTIGLTIHIQGSGADREVVGGDTTILAVPKHFYLSAPGGLGLAVQPLGKFLRELADAQAADLGEVLHHVDFVLTKDIEVMNELGIMQEHENCTRCRESLASAILYMTEHPDDEMVVGQLYWAGP